MSVGHKAQESKVRPVCWPLPVTSLSLSLSGGDLRQVMVQVLRLPISISFFFLKSVIFIDYQLLNLVTSILFTLKNNIKIS